MATKKRALEKLKRNFKNEENRLEVLGTRIQLYLWTVYVLVCIIILVLMIATYVNSASTNIYFSMEAKPLVKAFIFVSGTYFLLAGFVGRLTKSMLWSNDKSGEIGFFGKNAEVVSRGAILLALTFYYYLFTKFK